MSTLTIFGSYGEFTIDADSGLPQEPVPEDYKFATKFDVVEHKTWAKAHGFDDSDCLDILEIGYWYVDEKGVQYEPPDSFHRGIVEKGCPRPIVGDEGLASLLGGPNGI